jgi:hypothetical protein
VPLGRSGSGKHQVRRLIDQVYANLDLDSDPTGDWTQQLASLSQAIREHLLAHPAVVPYALQQPGLGPRAGTDPQTSDEFVRRMWAFFAALPPGEFPHTVELAAQLARISTDDQFQFGIRTSLAGLNAQQPEPKHSA